MTQPHIAPATLDLLQACHPPGTRHEAAKKIAISMIGDGNSEQDVFVMLRGAFDAEKTDKELWGLIRYAKGLPLQPSGYRNGIPTSRYSASYRPYRGEMMVQPSERVLSPLEKLEWWTNGRKTTIEEFRKGSDTTVPEDRKLALFNVLELLYNGVDHINLVCDFDMQGSKARPKGAGKILTRDKWLEFIDDKGIPFTKAGCWVRPNPVAEVGSGHGGAVTDSDVTSFRFLLVESDALPIEHQLAFFACLKLPIAAVTLSGAVSAHAWVRMDCQTIEEYESMARRILGALKPFGFDEANKNPSRLSRLPGAHRTIGAVGDGFQDLLWLNPSKVGITPKDVKAFEDSLLIQVIEELPFKVLLRQAIPRIEEMMANRGKTGVQLGLPTFDKVSGGLKPGGYTLIAAQTGVGKSSLALNIINHNLKAGVGVILFSLEMSREFICDMMLVLNCRINRNKFNTGDFEQTDIESMAREMDWMEKLPLWIDDDPGIGIDGIRKRVMQLTAAKSIKLAVVDYAQLALPDSHAPNREQAVAGIALGLRLLTRDAKIPIIVLSQLNDENRVRESRKLAHEAENLFILQRDSEVLTDPNMTLKIAKGRKIPPAPIKLLFTPEFCQITEKGAISAEDVPSVVPPWSPPPPYPD